MAFCVECGLMKISEQLKTMFNEAQALNAELNAAWIKISLRIGGRLPHSLLSVSIQRDGAVDLLLRAIEDEQARQIAKTGSHDGFGFHYQKMMSDYWIGGVYETFRLLKSRELADPAPAFAEIFADLEPTRVTIDKHELAQERKLKTAIEMVRLPQKNDASDKYVYDKTDKQRSHIMGMGISIEDR